MLFRSLQMGTANGREDGTVIRATDENQMGKLQPQVQKYPAQYRSRQETARVPRIHLYPRDGALVGTNTQCPLRLPDGRLHAQLEVLPGGAKLSAGSA